MDGLVYNNGKVTVLVQLLWSNCMPLHVDDQCAPIDDTDEEGKTMEARNLIFSKDFDFLLFKFQKFRIFAKIRTSSDKNVSGTKRESREA